MDEYSDVTLSSIRGGAVEELFQNAMQQLLANYHDINTDPEARRSIDIKLIFIGNEERSEFKVGITVTPKLASVRGTTATIYTGDRKVAGKYRAVESNFRQMRLSDNPVVVAEIVR